MLPKEKRIPRGSFSDVLKNGRSFHFLFISIKIVRSDEENSRFSFVVPKTVSKSAVKRNLVRRRGYSILGKHLESIKKPYLYAFFMKKGVEKLTFDQFESEIVAILKKTGMYAQ